MKKYPELAILATDAYKLSHRILYPEGTEFVYSNMTPRANSYFKYSDKYIAFGSELFVERFLIDYWKTNFFDLEWETVAETYAYIIKNGLGDAVMDLDSVKYLYDLGYLPLEVKALPEGARAKVGVPMITVVNTDPKLYWLTNYIETALLSEVFPVFNAASIAREFKKIAVKFANETSDDLSHIPFQFHDFSRRGHHGNDSGLTTTVGHLTSFAGSDSIQAPLTASNYYNANLNEELVYGSVIASEHSVASSYGGKEYEENYFADLIHRNPTGILSLVSDTYDYNRVIEEILPSLHKEIMERDGKLVVRPDSGNIKETLLYTLHHLYDSFGGTTNTKGYKVLDPHVGILWGEGITLDNLPGIMQAIMDEGFDVSNVVFGVGAYSYSVLNTRDTFGTAFKTTLVQVNGEERKVSKEPTGSALKRSALGGVSVHLDTETNEYLLHDNLSFNDVLGNHEGDALEVIFKDGVRTRHTDFKDIRKAIEQTI